MSEKEELEITINAEGEVEIEVIGGAGKRCLRITRSLEEGLGEVMDRQLLTEFYGPGLDDKEVSIDQALGDV